MGFALWADHRSHPGGLPPVIRCVSWHRALQTILELILEVTLRKGPWCWQSSVGISPDCSWISMQSPPAHSSHVAKVFASLRRKWFICGRTLFWQSLCRDSLCLCKHVCACACMCVRVCMKQWEWKIKNVNTIKRQFFIRVLENIWCREAADHKSEFHGHTFFLAILIHHSCTSFFFRSRSLHYQWLYYENLHREKIVFEGNRWEKRRNKENKAVWEGLGKGTKRMCLFQIWVERFVRTPYNSINN